MASRCVPGQQGLGRLPPHAAGLRAAAARLGAHRPLLPPGYDAVDGAALVVAHLGLGEGGARLAAVVGGDGDEASAPEASTPVGESAEGSVPGGAGSTLARRADDSLDGFFGAPPSPSERRDRRLGFAASSDDSLDSESSGALLSGDASSDDGEEGGLALAEDGLPYGLDADLRRAEMFRAASEEAS